MKFTIEEPLFESKIRVYYNEPPDEFVKAARITLEDDSIEFFDKADCHGKCLIRGDWRTYYLWLDKAKKQKKIDIMSYLTHELCHIGTSFMESVGHEASVTSELLPYFVDYYFKEICRKIWKT